MTLDGELVEDLRETMGARVRDLLGLPDSAAPVTDAWTAYVEARALRWSAAPATERPRSLAAETDHCVRALRALLDLS